MLKKYLSGVIALGMGLSLIPFNVMAENGLSIKSFNVTKSAVIIDFNGITDGSYIDKDTVMNNIILEKHSIDGKITAVTDYNVTVQEKEVSGTDAGGKAVAVNKTNSVIIKPDEGISENAVYRIVVKDGLTDADGVKAAEESTEWFGIDVLFSDDFEAEGKYTKDTAEYPYYWGDSDNTYLLSKYWNTTKAYGAHIGNTTNKTDQKNYSVMRWFTNGANICISEEGLPADERVSDYTVEYKYQYPGYANGGSHYINMRAAETDTSYNINTGYKVQLRNNKANVGTLTAPIKIYAGNKILATSEEYTPSAMPVNVRMSTIGDNIQYFIDDDKIFDITDSSYKDAGTTGFSDNNATQYWAPSYIDDVLVTRIIKYGNTLPEITVQDAFIYDGIIVTELSQEPEGQETEKYVTLIGENGEIGIDVDIDGAYITVTPAEALSDGEYILTFKEGIYAKNSAMLENPYQVAFEVNDGIMNMISIKKPEITDLNMSVLNGKFTITFDYDGENENNSRYYVYSSETKDGEFAEIASGILNGEELIIDADEKFVDCWLKVKIAPKDSKGYLNNSFYSDIFKGMFTPIIKKVNFEDNFENGSVEISDYIFYDENGDEDLTEIQWYAADELDGEYKPIENAVGKELVIDSVLRDKFVKAYITPKTDTYPYEGETYISEYFCRVYEPEAKDVKITGEAEIGNVLKGEYTYYDKNREDEKGTTYRWLISDSIDGTYKEVEGLIGKEYEIKDDDIGKFIKFEVTPKKEGAEGTAVLSSAFALPAKPVAKKAEVSGTVKVGYTVSGVYEYYHINGVKEGESEYKWYVGGNVVSEDKMYTIKSSDAGKKICFEVTPVAVKEPKKGEPVKSEEVTIKANSSGNSGGSSGTGSSGGTGGGIGSGIIIGQIQDNINKVQDSNTELITNFTDIDDSLYKKEIVELYDKGIINGVSLTEFRPNRNITRAEFVTLMVKLLKLNVADYENVFLDVSKDSWYANNIQTAYNRKLIEGYAGYFRPNDGIKIEEILKILIESYEKQGTVIEPEEENINNVSEWAKPYADKAVALGIIDNKEFTLNGFALREEAAVLIYRFLEKAGDLQ